ncbi:uncharacterized protein KY384_003978 [Bacidia gigantensis]|uniref:uncharacterized protein n=1 Tax=Bacidia gigantensis TaxID=2732470 RepID=UPI001D05775B|nr:uncharacterized protein KY384_003978 [Bacidia gigantensis]KAG8532337.1 hypothetical protein KY384_003978 [Bacidia gigantensis]
MAPTESQVFARSLDALNSAAMNIVHARREITQPKLNRRGLDVNSTQKATLGVIVAYIVVIALLWNLPYVRWVLWPFKMLVIAFHEFSHAITSCCTGGRVESISLDPHEGGVTHMRGGISAITLPAGYLGSSLIGGEHCARRVFSTDPVVGTEGLVDDRDDWIERGACDDLILRKVNSSDASVFAKRYGGSSQCWGVIWSVISLTLMVISIVAGIAAFHQSFDQQEKDSKKFIPTF